MDVLSFLWQCLAQTILCLGLGIWLSFRLERSPTRGHFALFLALLASLLTPVLGFLVWQFDLGLLVGPASPTVFETAHSPGTLDHPRSDVEKFVSLVLIGWSLVSLGLIARVFSSFRKGRELVARAEPVVDPSLLSALNDAKASVGVRSEIDLRVSHDVTCPMLWAWSEIPVILIPDPKSLKSESVDWSAVFVHELAHLRRKDHLVELITQIAGAALFWNPLVWWAIARLRRASEFACDEQVPRSGYSSLEYCSTLLALSSRRRTEAGLALTLSRKATTLKSRIVRLLNSPQEGSPPGRRWISLALAVFVIVILTLTLPQVRPDDRPEVKFANQSSQNLSVNSSP